MNQKNESKRYKSPRMFSPTDVMIMIVLIISSIIFIPYIHSHPGDFIEVYRSDQVIAKYPLSENRIFYIEGLKGTMKMEIKDKRVRVVSSPCPQQICVHTGWISETHEQIICAPNLIFISVKVKREKESIDALTH